MTNFTTGDGLAGNTVTAIAVDFDGTLWIGTWGGGVSRYDGLKFTSYTSNDGLSSNFVYSIAVDSRNSKWFGTGNGLSRLGSDRPPETPVLQKLTLYSVR